MTDCERGRFSSDCSERPYDLAGRARALFTLLLLLLAEPIGLL